MSTHEERLRRHLWAVMENTPQAARLESAFTGDRKEFAGAAGAVAKLRADPERPFAPREVSRLEAIVLPKLRPVFDVVDDSFADPPAPWKLLSAARKKIETAIRTVGRVELDGLPGVPYGGTAFIVGPGLMLTNRHVAEFFTSGVGDRGLKFIPGRTVAVDLKQEIGSNEIRRLKVRRVLMVHPYWDACLLEVTGLPASQPQLTLMARQPADFKKRDVAVIGYPAPDPYANLALQMQIFRGVFYKKRLQPGKTIGYKPVKSYLNNVESLAHDCSTLGGNSGSVVLDVKTGQAIGLHFAGAYLEANYSVPAWQLGSDPRIVDLGVKFSAKPAKGSAAPKWLSFWKSLDEPAAKKTGGKKRARTEAPAISDDASLGSPAAPGDWAERAPADLMARSLAVDPERITDALTATFGPDEGRAMEELLSASRIEEGLIFPEPNPDFPEIVWTHGILGGHLASPGFLRDRHWLDPLELVVGQTAGRLTLASDGYSESGGGRPLEPDGLLALFYMKARLSWQRKGFVVHEFSFDWRKSIAWLADRLQDLLLARRRQNPAARFAIVAHSMGGMVAAMYAKRHGEWSDLIQRAVLIGAPLGGSFAPMEAALGSYDFIRKLAMLSVKNDIDSFRRMAVTLPGLLDMLPNPDLFTGIEALYSSATWPDGIAPLQRWLDQSRFLKREVLDSPLLGRSTLIVSTSHPTVASFVRRNGRIERGPADAPGDGTVPLRAAAIDGVPAFKAANDHSSLPLDPAAIQAVVDLLTTGKCGLPPVTKSDFKSLTKLAPEAAFQEAALLGIRRRLEAGVLRLPDLRWLFQPGFDSVPEG